MIGDNWALPNHVAQIEHKKKTVNKGNWYSVL